MNEMGTHTKCNQQINNQKILKNNKNLLLGCFLGHSVIFGLGQPWLTSRSWWQGVTRIITQRIFLYGALYLPLWRVLMVASHCWKKWKKKEKKNGNKNKLILDIVAQCLHPLVVVEVVMQFLKNCLITIKCAGVLDNVKLQCFFY